MSDSSVKNNIKVPKIIGLIVFILLLIYILAAYFFVSHYTYGTYISGTDCSFKSKEEVYSSFSNKHIDESVILIGRNGYEWNFFSDDINSDIVYDLSGLERNNGSILDEINWVKNCYSGKHIDIKADFVFEDEAFLETLEGSPLCIKSGAIEPKDAYLAGYDEEASAFIIKEGNPGNILDRKKTLQVVRDALCGVNIQDKVVKIDLNEADCFKKSNMSVENIKLIHEKEKADKMLQAKISYDWNGVRVIVDGSVIKDWIDIEDNVAVLNSDKVLSYLMQVADDNDTYNKPMTFWTATGHRKTIKRGNYGWKTDVDKEAELLIDDVLLGRQVSREPIYSHTAYVKGQNDVGDTYVEVDLANQHLYLIVNGKIDYESDVVSGNVSAGHNTPDGIYGVTYKTVNATLRGPGYESFVYYWMPYNGGVGLHDATWRGKFGGEIYKYSGSHGCVNLPLATAKYIYGVVETGFPVVTYW